MNIKYLNENEKDMLKTGYRKKEKIIPHIVFAGEKIYPVNIRKMDDKYLMNELKNIGRHLLSVIEHHRNDYSIKEILSETSEVNPFDQIMRKSFLPLFERILCFRLNDENMKNNDDNLIVLWRILKEFCQENKTFKDTFGAIDEHNGSQLWYDDIVNLCQVKLRVFLCKILK
jgi:hypothetical protein